jgi:uncharacterized protein YjbI with pentapeptide repeats
MRKDFLNQYDTGSRTESHALITQNKKKLLIRLASIIQNMKNKNQDITPQIKNIIIKIFGTDEETVNKIIGLSIHRNKIFSYFNPFFTKSLSLFLKDCDATEQDILSCSPSNAHLKDLFSNLNLSNLDLSNIEFNNTQLTKANLKKTTCENTKFINTDLASASLCNATIKNAEFSGSDTSCDNVNFKNASIINTKFNGTNIDKAKFENATLSQVDFINVEIWEANFTKVKGLQDLKFTGENSYYLNFLNACVENNNFLNSFIDNSLKEDEKVKRMEWVITLLHSFYYDNQTPDKKYAQSDTTTKNLKKMSDFLSTAEQQKLYNKSEIIQNFINKEKKTNQN